MEMWWKVWIWGGFGASKHTRKKNFIEFQATTTGYKYRPASQGHHCKQLDRRDQLPLLSVWKKKVFWAPDRGAPGDQVVLTLTLYLRTKEEILLDQNPLICWVFSLCILRLSRALYWFRSFFIILMRIIPLSAEQQCHSLGPCIFLRACMGKPLTRINLTRLLNSSLSLSRC